MTVDSPAIATVECPACRQRSPAGLFCGWCGAALAAPADFWSKLLRPRMFVVAPRETITLPVIVDSLFPHLARSARNPFRVALLLLAAGLVGFAVLRLPGPLVTLAGLGLPLLFVLYLWQSGVLRDMPRHHFAVPVILGALLGAGWVLLTGGLVARSYGMPMATGLVLDHVVSVGLGLTVGGAVVMMIPAVVVRLSAPRDSRSLQRESLDGFVVGAMGALTFTGISTLTNLAPQFVSGLFDDARPSGLLAEAAVYGIAAPLTAAATGGLMGLALWFRPGPRAGRHPRRIRAVLAMSTGILVALYMAVWLVYSARLPQVAATLLQLELAVPALLALRTGMQLALLHESQDPSTGQPWLCVRCERVVPEMAFCPACGAAVRASSRASRRERRESRPVRATQAN